METPREEFYEAAKPAPKPAAPKAADQGEKAAKQEKTEAKAS
ncbi:hypothetical protein STENM327S_06761 [Streptomyces tendae]